MYQDQKEELLHETLHQPEQEVRSFDRHGNLKNKIHSVLRQDNHTHLSPLI